MKTYSIDELYGMAYDNAITYTRMALENVFGNINRDWFIFEKLAQEFNFKFNANGEPVKED